MCSGPGTEIQGTGSLFCRKIGAPICLPICWDFFTDLGGGGGTRVPGGGGGGSGREKVAGKISLMRKVAKISHRQNFCGGAGDPSSPREITASFRIPGGGEIFPFPNYPRRNCPLATPSPPPPPVQGGGFRDGNISLWEISYFKCVRNFPLNFQATVRNKSGAKFSHDA